jgi:hypothetical protein
MSRRISCSWTLCSLVAALNLSCYYPESGTVTTEVEAIPAAQLQLEPEDQGARTESLEPARTAAASEQEPTGSSSESLDAEVVLKSALARAADEKKRVLVHLGAPG